MPRVVADAFEQLLFAEGSAQNRPKLVRDVYGWMMETGSHGLAGGLLAMRERKDYTPLLGTFTLPCLVIGALRDRAIPLDQVRILEAGLPAARTCLIEDAGHMANLEEAGAFNACLLEFLRGLAGEKG